MIETMKPNQMKMKKLMMVAMIMVTGWMAQAQPKVTSAYNANKEGKFEDAKQYIDEAMADPKATEKEKYWRYRGNIYANLVKDSVLFAKYPDALKTSLAAFSKYFEIDKRKDYIKEVATELDILKAVVGQKAERSYKANNLSAAGDQFQSIVEISSVLGVTDTVFIFNSAFCYHKAGRTEDAINNYKKCVDLKYNVRDSYLGISDIYISSGKKAEAIQILTQARQQYPKDAEFLRSEVNIYIDDKDYAKAQGVLKALTESDPKNESVWFVLGVTYEKENNTVDAEKAYLNALSIKADYFDAAYNIGALYYNQAQEKGKVCDAIPPRETAKFDACKAELKPMYLKAAGYFEICYKQDSNDAQLKQALKETYLKGGDREKSNLYK